MLYICDECSEYKDADYDAPYELPSGEVLCQECAEALGYDLDDVEEDHF